MARVWKEVLCVGRQCDPAGRWYEFAPRDIRAALRNARKMLARGLSVPAIWEHQPIEVRDRPRTPGQLAEWKRRYAKFAFGHIVDARINDRGNLDLLHEVRDPKDVRQLLKTRFVSPKVYPSYSDSRGGEYRGTTIAHVAATPTPVQHWQRPWELSRGDALYLSYTPPEGSAVPDDPKNDGAKGAAGDLGALIEALRDSANMAIPDEVTDIPGLIIAIKAAGGSGGGGGGGGGDDDDDDDGLNLDTSSGTGATAPAGGAPLMMSTTDADGPRRNQALAWAKDERREIKRRIEDLFRTGRIDRPTARQLFRQSKAVEMSFTADAEAVSPLHKKLVELEKRAANAAWKAGDARDLSATRGVDPPKGLTGAGADTKATADWLCAGLPAAPAKK